MLQLPLIFFFVVPIVVIAAGFQSNGLEAISAIIFRLLFIGHISEGGDIKISSAGALAGAVVVWLFILQLVSMAIQEIEKRTGRQVITGSTSRLIFTLLWLAGYVALLASPHTGSAFTFAMIFGLFYIVGLGVLLVYQLIGRAVFSAN